MDGSPQREWAEFKNDAPKKNQMAGVVSTQRPRIEYSICLQWVGGCE